MRSSVWPNLISFFIIVFCIYLLTTWHPHSLENDSKTLHENAFFSKIHLQQFNEKGELSTQFHALRLSVLSNNETLFSKPIFSLLGNGSGWTATSDQGNGYNNGEKIKLSGSVHLTQLPSAQSPQTDIFTQRPLWIFPKKSFARTREKIQIIRPGEQSQLQGDSISVHAGPNNEIQNLVAVGKPAHYKSIEKGKPAPLEASAGLIRFNVQQNIAILEKNAKVTQGKDGLRGDYIWYDAKRGLTKTKSTVAQHKTVITLEPQKPAK